MTWSWIITLILRINITSRPGASDWRRLRKGIITGCTISVTLFFRLDEDGVQSCWGVRKKPTNVLYLKCLCICLFLNLSSCIRNAILLPWNGSKNLKHPMNPAYINDDVYQHIQQMFHTELVTVHLIFHHLPTQYHQIHLAEPIINWGN